MTYPFPVFNVTATTENHARAIVFELWDHSCWFSVTPLPDDEWLITVKDEEPVKSVVVELQQITRPSQKYLNFIKQ